MRNGVIFMSPTKKDSPGENVRMLSVCATRSSFARPYCADFSMIAFVSAPV